MAFEAECAAGAPGRWLSISGDAGTGKTFLARQLFDRCQRYNPGNASLWIGPAPRPVCVWLDASDFAQQLKGGDYQLPERLRTEFLVVLDDMGSTYDRTEFVVEATYRLLNGRMGKWTIITSNLSGNEISNNLDARITSRLIRDHNRFVQLTCPDYARKTG